MTKKNIIICAILACIGVAVFSGEAKPASASELCNSAVRKFHYLENDVSLLDAELVAGVYCRENNNVIPEAIRSYR